MATKKRVLLVEDDPQIIEAIRNSLDDFGMPVELVSERDGGRAVDLALGEYFDLIILDINLPSVGGFDICKKVRQSNRLIPILMLTGRAEQVNKVLGLELGADDYLVKPFEMPELVARIRALFRRVEVHRTPQAPKGAEQPQLQIGKLSIDFDRREIALDGETLTFSATEFDIISFLAKHAGKTLSREQILEHVLGYDRGTYDSSISSHINRIRRRLEPTDNSPKYIRTVRGVGYRFATEEELASES